MEKNQKKVQNFFFNLRKNSSTLTLISSLLLLSLISFFLKFKDEFYHIFFIQFNQLKLFLNKKAIFFFFNAILLFLAKSSGFLASSIEQPPMATRLTGLNSGEKTQISPEKELNFEENQQIFLEVREIEKKKSVLIEGDCILEEEEEDDEEIGGEMEDLGLDELNKKCEEFILRFIKERKMEALQMVKV